ncbi:MAG: DUF2933 domain-containing protein [Candidatus Rokubacteria bacterium]|nr:DUF2933 domain-containing protein [Candidatus Rokubacteria bacterium]
MTKDQDLTKDRDIGRALKGPETTNGSEPVDDGRAYCGFCGIDLASEAIPSRQFGLPFCSEVHAEVFAREVRAARVAGVAAAGNGGERQSVGAPDRAHGKRWDLKRLLKLAACWILPILAVVFLAGDGAALLGAGAAALPVLAVLACPLAMFFLMRAMAGHEDGEGKSKKSPLPGSHDSGR